MAVPPEEPLSEARADQPRWSRIYAGVIGCTAVVIILLYLFSRHYSG